MAETQFHDVLAHRVRFAETDAQGVVFYGEYVTYQDEAFNAFLRETGYDYDQLEQADWDVHVVHVDVDYRAPAEFEDVLVEAIRVDAIRDSSIEFDWRCRRKADDVLVAEGGLTHVAVDEDGDSMRVPRAFRDAVVAYQDSPPNPV